MNTANIQCLTVEIAPSQIIEVQAEVRAIPAGDLAALENVREQATEAAEDARNSANLARIDAVEADNSAALANQERIKARDAASAALESSVDAETHSDLASKAADISEQVLSDVTLMHADVEEAWGGINHATLVAISAELVRTQALMVEFHGFQ